MKFYKNYFRKIVFFSFWGLCFFLSSGAEVYATWGDIGDLFSNDCIVDLDFELDFDAGNEPVFNGPGLKKGAKLVKCKLDDGVSKEESLKVLIIGWTKFFLSVTATIAIVALIWAGFMYVTSGGDESRTESAKKIVLWVALGMILILASYAIVNTIMQARFGA